MAGSATRYYRGECGLYSPGTLISLGQWNTGYGSNSDHWRVPTLYPSLYQVYHNRSWIELPHLTTADIPLMNCLITKRGILAQRGHTRGQGMWFDAYHILLPCGTAAWVHQQGLIPNKHTVVNKNPFDILPRHLWPEICEI